jgi:hypothetical protein
MVSVSIGVSFVAGSSSSLPAPDGRVTGFALA